jgi:hemerythrin
MTSTWEAELLRKANQLEIEHAYQVRLLDDLLRALETGDREAVGPLLGQVLDASNFHFGEEEVLMRQHSYPGSGAHTEAHRQMIAALQGLAARHSSGALTLAEVSEVRGRFVGHIQTLDREAAAYLAQARLEP